MSGINTKRRENMTPLEIAIEALEFYADPEANTLDGDGECYGFYDDLEYNENWTHDNGDVAKEALNFIRKNQNKKGS